MGLLSTLAREIARGAVLGWFDAMREAQRVLVESPDDADRALADRVARALGVYASDGDPSGPDDPTPDYEPHTDPGLSDDRGGESGPQPHR